MLEGALIADQFRLHYQIGEGGMGTVWAAEDLRLGRMVAAKFLSRHMAAQPRVRERFQREARMTARVRSAHVVQVFAEGCTEDDIPYLIMELLEGEDLSTHLQRRERCELAETGPIVEQICRGLGQAHSEGLVHRDIKPHNIFLSKSEDATSQQPVIKLLDFGIAKDLGSLRDSLTACGEVVGSALYSSPEQLREPQTVERAADIWAIGVVIFEMLTGRVPYEASTLSELIGRQADGHFPKVSSLVSSLPRELDGFLNRTLHSVASKRWASVEELAHEYSAIVRKYGAVSDVRSSTGFAAAPTSPAAHSGARPMPARHGRGSLVLIALALLLCIAGLAWKQLSPPPAAASRKQAAKSAGYAKPAVQPEAAAGSPASQTLVEPEISQQVQPPEPALPQEQEAPAKPAAPRGKKAATRTSREPASSEAPSVRHDSSPTPATNELPGRNHGF